MNRFTVFVLAGLATVGAIGLSGAYPGGRGEAAAPQPLILAQAETQTHERSEPQARRDTRAAPRPERRAKSPGLTRTNPAPGGAFEFWPGARYSSDVPTLEDVVGHKNGAEITTPAETIRYFRALQQAAPDRVKLFEYARSWEDRPLIFAVIGTPARIAALDEIREQINHVADPRARRGEDVDALTAELPATVWIAYGVHGNEISGTDAAIMSAYHLLAAEDDAVVDKILDETLVFIDPMQNPDGRARFVHNFETTRGLEPDGSRIAAERNEPWPGGRTNHYLFDMNRDWFAMTQPETVGRVETIGAWKPLVFVDAHEMGSDATYYFAPEAVPYNPHLAAGQRASLELFGRNNAKWFDANGFDYFTREVFDAFYPGYGASWPSYFGSVAMTYEQASARGLMARRLDGSQYHYRDTVRQHFVASISTMEAAADNRKRLWRDFADYQDTAIEEGRSEEIRTYILPAEDDAAGAGRIAALLTKQGAEVYTATENFTACGRSYKAGAHAIPMAQPAKRRLRTMLDPDTPMDEQFTDEQERLREKDLPDQIYDVTAWSLPLMFNVRADACDVAVSVTGNFERHDGTMVRPGRFANKAGAIAYLIAWGERPAIRALAHLHREGVRVRSTSKAFTHEGVDYPAGTLIVPARNTVGDLPALLSAIAQITGADIEGVDTGWVSAGPNFGSFNVATLPAPKIAIAWDAPTNPYMAGATRFVIERQFDYPVTAVRVDDLGGRDLDRFDVLILPGQLKWFGGGLKGRLGESGAGRLKEWVSAGGVVVATGGAVGWLADPSVGLISIRPENAARDEDAPETNGEADRARLPGAILATKEDARAAIAPPEEGPDSVGGVIARAQVDQDHWLGAGVAPTINALVSGGQIFAPATLDRGVNVARFVGPDDLLISGYMWRETRDQFAYKPFVVAESMGAGQVIAFTQDPTRRAYLDGLNVLFANAIFRAPAYTRRPR